MPVLFMCFLIFCAWLNYEIKKSNQRCNKGKEQFWSREIEANKVRKVDITNLDYIKIPMEELPFFDTNDDSLIQIQNKVKALSELSILNLTGISNTDLKLQYGAPNLSFLTQCDQNFIILARTLNDWAVYLYKQQDISNAKKVLEFAVSSGSDIKNTYILLSDIYETEHLDDNIKKLISKAENLNSLNKSAILAYLNKTRCTD